MLASMPRTRHARFATANRCPGWLWTAAVAGTVATGCSADETTANEPPSLYLAADDASVGQGQTKTVEVLISDPDGDTVMVDVTSLDPELEVDFDETQQQLRLHASYATAGTVALSAHLSDERGAEQTIALDIQVTPIRWLASATWTDAEGPEAREHGAVAVDPEGAYALLIGGSGYSPYLEALDDVWRYDLASGSWTEVTPTGDVPAPAGSRRLAHIPGTTTAYLFGGYASGGSPSLADLFELDFGGAEADFRLVPQENPPPARSLHAFVHDPDSSRFVVFGGFGTGIHDDTWVMTMQDGTAVWTELDLDPRPSPRYGFFYGFDAEHGRLVVFSGAQGTTTVDPAHDTWVLDLRAEPPAWTRIADASTSPPGRRNGCMVFDPSGPRLWIYGGTPDASTSAPGLWVLDTRPTHELWTELGLDGAPALRSSGFGFYDPASDRSLLGFGNTALFRYQDWNSLGY